VAIHRRSLLKSLSIGAVAPFLHPLVARVAAETAGSQPMRFVFYIEGNGFPPAHAQPVGIERKIMKNPTHWNQITANDRLIDLPLSSPGVSLPETLAPLQKHAKRLTIVQGLSGRICGGGHQNAFGALGCYPQQAGPKDVTIDAAVAKARPSIHQHVALGFNQTVGPSMAPMFYACSASGPNTKVPHYQDPKLAYDMLFGKIVGGNPKAEVNSQAKLLAYMAKDIGRLAKQLPLEEARKAEQYADAFSEIGRRQSQLGEIDSKRIPPRDDKLYGSMLETERMQAHCEVAATALITGLTNTVTLSSGGASYPMWKGLGAEVDNHALAHQCGNNPNAIGDTEPQKMRAKIREFNMGLVTSLVDRLEAIPEGGGSMMDNTLIVYLSDSAEDHHDSCYEWPLLMLGNLGGRLKAGDRFLNVPGYHSSGEHRTVAQFYTALLHAAGAPVEHFGMKDRKLLAMGNKQEGPWTDILA
jgi:hypothetical protein